jgi:Lrp/AsnC family transcriptional regulator for asnA, asnC and gidA
MPAMKIDATDVTILKLLQKNGRMSNTEIARLSGVSENTVRYRLQKLLKSDFFQIVGIVDPLKLGNGLEGTIRLKVDIKHLREVGSFLSSLPQLFYVARVSGSVDFEASFFVKGMSEARALIDRINAEEGVVDTDMVMVLEYVKERYDYGEYELHPSEGRSE